MADDPKDRISLSRLQLARRAYLQSGLLEDLLPSPKPVSDPEPERSPTDNEEDD
jgi:hypothetical protein